MDRVFKYRIPLTDGQKRKLRSAFRRRRSIVIGLTRDQLSRNSGDTLLLTEWQKKAIDKAAQGNKGMRLMIAYDQLVKNKEGGLLNEMLSMVETKVPLGKEIISPLVRGKIAPLLKEQFIPWLKKLIDKELDSVITGSGLKRRINSKLDELLGRKKKSSPCRSVKSRVL